MLARYDKWRNAKHLSGWDNPTTGTDLLAAMLHAKKRKDNPLP